MNTFSIQREKHLTSFILKLLTFQYNIDVLRLHVVVKYFL